MRSARHTLADRSGSGRWTGRLSAEPCGCPRRLLIGERTRDTNDVTALLLAIGLEIAPDTRRLLSTARHDGAMTNAAWFDGARARLAVEHTETTARLESLRRGFDVVVRAAEGSNADDEHDPEGSTIAYERSQLSAMVAQAKQHLAEIDRASERIAAGTYGRCTICRRPIPLQRMQARPTADACVECAATMRRRRR